jgi:hypothetical protein
MAKIAKLILNIPTLECRNMDALDFHELHVAEIELALRLAYEVVRSVPCLASPSLAALRLAVPNIALPGRD